MFGAYPFGASYFGQAPAQDPFVFAQLPANIIEATILSGLAEQTLDVVLTRSMVSGMSERTVASRQSTRTLEGDVDRTVEFSG